MHNNTTATPSDVARQNHELLFHNHISTLADTDHAVADSLTPQPWQRHS
jgi:hypothetical protein